MEFEIRSLAGSAAERRIPVHQQSTLNQTIRLKQDETTLVGGLRIEKAAEIAGPSLPGLGEVPGLGLRGAEPEQYLAGHGTFNLITPRKLRSRRDYPNLSTLGRTRARAQGGPGLAPQQPQQVPQPQPQQQHGDIAAAGAESPAALK